MITNGRECTSPDWLRAMRELEYRDDPDTSFKTFPMADQANNLSATADPSRSTAFRCTGEATGTRAEPDGREESIEALLSRAEANPLFQRQAS